MLNYYQSADLDRVFHSLADGTRRGIIEQLSNGRASVKELAEPYEMSLPAVMLHLQILENSGLIESKKEGRVRLCTLTPQPIQEAKSWIEARASRWNEMFDEYSRLVEGAGELRS